MAQLYVGTSGWAYPTWKPAFYPEKLAQRKFLNFYASKLNAVEVNYTFRQLVKETTVQNWMAETEERNTPDVVTADFAYYRYRKPSYTAEERQAMVARIQEHRAAGRDVFAYFKHEETPEGVLYAVDVLQAVGQK